MCDPMQEQKPTSCTRRGVPPQEWGLDAAKTLAIMQKNAGSRAYHSIMTAAKKNGDDILEAKVRAMFASNIAKCAVVLPSSMKS